MKKSAWDNKLWHDKMQQLPLEGDANAAWQKMQGLLDENMPVNATALPKPGGFFHSKVVQVLGAIVVAAVIFYVAYYLLNKHPDTGKQKEKHYAPTTKAVAGNNREEKRNTAQSPLPVGEKIKSDTLTKQASGKVNTDDLKASAQTNTSVAKQKPGVSDNKFTASNITDASGNTGSAKKAGHHLTGVKNGSVASVGGHSAMVNVYNAAHHIHRVRAHQNLHSTPIINGRQGVGNGVGYTQNQPPQKQVTDTGAMKQVNKNPAAKGYLSAADSVNMGLVKNNTNLTNTPANKPLTTSPTTVIKPGAGAGNPQNKPAKLTAKTKPKSNKNTGDSKFQFGINAGVNTSSNLTSAFFGVSGKYSIAPKWGIGVGVNILPQKLITGGFSDTSYKYITIDDSGRTTRHTADKLTVKSTRKVYTIDIPVILSYRLNNFISLKAGPIIGIPVKTGSIKNTLSPFSNPIDTLSAYKVIDSAANSTTINNSLNFSFLGGVSFNLNRFYIDASYIQGLSPYTISSSLGSSRVYYHYFQFGIGYYLFKSKPKKSP